MSNFWENIGNTETNGEFEASTGFEPMPAGTQAVAIINEAKWDSYEDGPMYINLQWEIVQGEHKGRKVFHKLRVNDIDEKKAEKQQRMYVAIAHNAGGSILKIAREPTDNELVQHLCNKPMAIKLDVWAINDKRGNWVMAVSPVSKPQPVSSNSFDDIDF